MPPEEHDKKHHELAGYVDEIAKDIAERERFFNELNLLKLERRLFCFDPKVARQRTAPLTFDELKERPITIEPHPHYGQPSVLAYKVLQAIFRKLTSEGFPVPQTVSFSQRELATLVGRSSFGGQDGRQLYQAVMQLRTTLIHASFYDKEQDAWALANLNVLTDAFFSGQRAQVHACSISVHPRIIESLNSRHFACLNWARLAQLEPIGAALYKRLFYHFSNLMRPRTDPQLLPPFEKDYKAICAEWLGGLKPEQHKSKIVSNQLGRHLEALKQIRLIRRYEIERMADGAGWKLVF